MNIAMILSPSDTLRLPAESGSSVALLGYELARRVAASDRVRLCAPRHVGAPRREETREGLEIARVYGGFGRLREVAERLAGLRRPWRPFFASPLHGRGYLRRAVRALRDPEPDVVHFHSHAQHAPRLRAAFPRAGLVLHMHGGSLGELPLDTLERQLGCVDRVLGCSDFVTSATRERFPRLAGRVHTLRNGADLERFRPGPVPPPAPLRILYVGRVSPEKGVHVLLEAFGHVLALLPDCELAIAGKPGLLPHAFIVGPSRDPRIRSLERFYGGNVRERIAREIVGRGAHYERSLRAGLRGRAAGQVSFLGHVAHDRLASLYRGAHVVAVPSVCEEPSGLSALEAMASGVAVVATRGGGLPEAVEDGVTGLLVERGDAAGLARALLCLLRDPERRAAMGRAGRARAERLFSWDRLAGELRGHYEAARRHPDAWRTSAAPC